MTRKALAAAGPGVRADPSRAGCTQWLVVVALLGAGVIAALQIGKAAAALPALAADLGLSLTTAGWVIGAFNVAGAMCGLVIGAGIDRVGHRRAALAGLGLIAVCSSLGALAHSTALLLASRLGEGLGFALTALAAPALLVRVTSPDRRGIVFGLWSSYVPAGIALGMLATPWLTGLLSWRAVWLAAGAIAAAWTVIILLATRSLRPWAGPPTARVLPTIRAVASSPAPLLLAGIFASYTAQFLSVFGFLPTLLASHYHLGTGTATVLSAVAVTANIPGNTLGGALRGKGAPRWAVISTASIVMAIAEIVIYTPGPALNIRYGACVLLALAGGTIPATLISSAPDFAPRPNTVAATMGALIQGSALGQTLGPPTLAALAAAVGGWQASPVMLGAAAAIAISLSIAVRRIEYRSHHTANRKQRPLPPLIGPRVWTSER